MHRRIASLLTLALALVVAAHVAPGWARSPIPKQAEASAVVEIVEFGDFQCPFCKRAHTTLAALKERYGDKLTVRFMHQPLAFHAQAMPAALAAEAARRQGAFDAMVDRLMDANAKLDTPTVEALALGLDIPRFEQDMRDPALKEKVLRDQRIANAVGAKATPSFYVNGLSLRGAQPLDKFVELIEQELDALPKGSKPGPKWIAQRTEANFADLHAYLYGGREPLDPAKAPERDEGGEDDFVFEPEAPAPAPPREVFAVTVDPERDGVLGPTQAKVTMVVFEGYECPFCRRFDATLTALRARYGDALRVVTKHSPLPFHKRSRPAAGAVVCARAQGQAAFAAMRAAVITEPVEALTDARFVQLAKALKLDAKAFERCLGAASTQAHIDADLQLAEAVGARGTPNSFVNGVAYPGAKPLEDWLPILDAALAEADKRLAEGVPLAGLYASLTQSGKRLEPLAAEVQQVGDKNAPVLGDVNAPVRVTAFIDLQCPFSAKAFPALRELVPAYGGHVSVQVRFFPLSFHKDAVPTAKAALCAHEQRGFWDFTSQVFARQRELPDLAWELPEELRMDTARQAECVQADKHAADVERDLADAKALGVKGTPTIFIQGRRFTPVTGGYTLEALKAAIDRYYPRR